MRSRVERQIELSLMDYYYYMISDRISDLKYNNSLKRSQFDLEHSSDSTLLNMYTDNGFFTNSIYRYSNNSDGTPKEYILTIYTNKIKCQECGENNILFITNKNKCINCCKNKMYIFMYLIQKVDLYLVRDKHKYMKFRLMDGTFIKISKVEFHNFCHVLYMRFSGVEKYCHFEKPI